GGVGTPHGHGHLPRLPSAAAARAGGTDAPRLRALRRLRHVLAGVVRGPDRPGPLPAPRRRDELPQDRRAVRPPRLDRIARRPHQLLPPTATRCASTASSPSCATRASSRRRARSTAGRWSSPRSCTRTLLVPGQELALHTDVPEFCGANRKLYPQ